MANRFRYNEYRLPHDGSVIRPTPSQGMFNYTNMENPFDGGGPKSVYDWRSPDEDGPEEKGGGASVPRNPKPKTPSGSTGKVKAS